MLEGTAPKGNTALNDTVTEFVQLQKTVLRFLELPRNCVSNSILIIHHSSVLQKHRQNTLDLQWTVKLLQDRCSNSDKSFIAMEILSKSDHG